MILAEMLKQGALLLVDVTQEKVSEPERLKLQHAFGRPGVGCPTLLRTSEGIHVGAVFRDLLKEPEVLRDELSLVPRVNWVSLDEGLPCDRVAPRCLLGTEEFSLGRIPLQSPFVQSREQSRARDKTGAPPGDVELGLQ